MVLAVIVIANDSILVDQKALVYTINSIDMNHSFCPWLIGDRLPNFRRVSNIVISGTGALRKMVIRLQSISADAAAWRKRLAQSP